MFGLLKELWQQISMDNPTTYYKLLQVSKIFKLDTDIMKARFIKKTNDGRGNIYHILPNGYIHSCDDRPAIISKFGTQYWYSNNKQHRDDDKPAVICANGDQVWYINGNRHRYNKPAIIYANGDQQWFINGELHHDCGTPGIVIW